MTDDDDGAFHASGSSSMAGPSRSIRTTRSATGALKSSKSAPKLKLKLGERGGPYASGMSFLGPYDRELDSDAEDDLHFEEQFILRVPEGPSLERMRKMAESREPAPDISFKFRDSRRGTFTIGNKTFNTKLVDLPCIIEAHKTPDKKSLFKVADISQMLVLEDPDTQAPGGGAFNVDEFIWTSGITPPLKHARKRRFRKRINKRTIETVEAEVERLLQADADADTVKWDVILNADQDLSDSEFINGVHQDHNIGTPAYEDGATPRAEDGDDGKMGNESDDEDEQFAAELERELAGSSGDEEEEEEQDGDDSEGSEEFDDDDDDDGEDDELEQGRKRLHDEMNDLDNAIAKKQQELDNTNNPVFKVCIVCLLESTKADTLRHTVSFHGCAQEAAGRPRHETVAVRRYQRGTCAAEGAQGAGSARGCSTYGRGRGGRPG